MCAKVGIPIGFSNTDLAFKIKKIAGGPGVKLPKMASHNFPTNSDQVAICKATI